MSYVDVGYYRRDAYSLVIGSYNLKKKIVNYLLY